MNLLAHDATLRRALEFRVRARRCTTPSRGDGAPTPPTGSTCLRTEPVT